MSSVDHLLSGLAGGAISTVLLYPLDLVKVRLQVNEQSSKSKRYGSICHTLRGVIRNEGILGLYQGINPAVLGSSASWGGYFFFYEGIKKEMTMRKAKSPKLNYSSATANDNAKNSIKLSSIENFGAACGAGAVMVILTNPIWLIKTRMQLQIRGVALNNIGKDVKAPYNGMLDAARTIVREEGPLALYKGAVPAMMLVSHGGVQFVAYEFLKDKFGSRVKASCTKGQDRNASVTDRLQDSMGYLMMGAVSKIIASTTTYPLQVIKARLQQRSQVVELTEAGEVQVLKREYSGVIDCLRRIGKQEGLSGFFKGCIPNALRVAPSAAITFVTYESVLDLLAYMEAESS